MSGVAPQAVRLYNTINVRVIVAARLSDKQTLMVGSHD